MNAIFVLETFQHQANWQLWEAVLGYDKWESNLLGLLSQPLALIMLYCLQDPLLFVCLSPPAYWTAVVQKV